jgi:hypothetical protein
MDFCFTEKNDDTRTRIIFAFQAFFK